MANIRGKSLKATTFDISEGYVAVNPIFLKSFNPETLKALYNEVMKTLAEVRSEKFPFNDTEAIRWRNMRMQRLHSAAMIIKNFARERRIQIV